MVHDKENDVFLQNGNEPSVSTRSGEFLLRLLASQQEIWTTKSVYQFVGRQLM